MQGPEFILNDLITQSAKITRDIHLAGNLGKSGLLKNQQKT
jgi:hypothetical protein